MCVAQCYSCHRKRRILTTIVCADRCRGSVSPTRLNCQSSYVSPAIIQSVEGVLKQGTDSAPGSVIVCVVLPNLESLCENHRAGDVAVEIARSGNTILMRGDFLIATDRRKPESVYHSLVRYPHLLLLSAMSGELRGRRLSVGDVLVLALE